MSQQQMFNAGGIVPPSTTFTATTIGATTADLIVVPLGATPTAYQLEALLHGFEATGPSGAGYNVFGTFKTTGLASTLVGNQDIFNEDAALAAADANWVAVGNTAVLRVLGVAGLTINWTGTYRGV